MRNTTSATIRKGKTTHLYYRAAQVTHCGADLLVAGTATPTADDAAVTCKHCLKEIAKRVERDHAEAIKLHEARTAEAAPAVVPPVTMLWHEGSGEAYLFEGTDETGEYVWLRDLIRWDAETVSVARLQANFTAVRTARVESAGPVPEAPAEPFTWLHLRVETTWELEALTQALEYRASAPTAGVVRDAARVLLDRLQATPRARQATTPVAEPERFQLRDLVRHVPSGREGNVDFVGVGGRMVHVKATTGARLISPSGEFVLVRRY